MTLYDYPEYYEVAYSFRDIPKEADFIKECINRFSKIEVKDIFEIACGPAPHAEELIKKGFKYNGLDLNRNMLDYAFYKWRNINPPIELIEADMKSFSFNRKVDFAFVMLGSLYLNNMTEIKSHFKSIADLLNPGGLYFLDWCVQFTDPLAYQDKNEISINKNGITVNSFFNIEMIDSAKQMYEEVWTVSIDDHGRHKKFEMTERNKAILPDEFLKLIENDDNFEFVGWWNDWNFENPIKEYSKTTRPIALIRRT